VREAEGRFVIYRELEDGYRWRLRSATSETLAASSAGHPSKGECETDMRILMADHHPDAEVLDAMSRERAK